MIAAPTTDAIERLRDLAAGPMVPGSVLVQTGVACFQATGGGEVQLARTVEGLMDLGLAVRPFQPWLDRVEDGRLLHLFGMSPEGLSLARVAKARGVPVVLSTVCWYEPRALVALAPGRARAARDLAAWAARRVCPRLPGWRSSLLAMADRVLPNSEAEGRQLARLFGVDRGKVRVVPNGVAPHFAGADPGPFRSLVGAGDFVLYAGRIEPRKNVDGLVRACGEAGLPLVVVGDAVPGHEGYADRCRAEGGDRVRWLPRLGPDDPRLASAFGAARVFALPSWFETPGLAALEAALAGCPVVITPFGCTREYFGDRVEYARPGSVREIAGALRRAWDRGRDGATELADLVEGRNLWARVARLTAEVYDEVAPTR